MPPPEVTRRIDESDVTARSGRLKEQVWTPFRLGVGERLRSKEGIIAGVQEECGNLYPIQISARARFLPILLRVAKTVDWRGVEAIEFSQRSDPMASGDIQTVREEQRLSSNFGQESAEKAPKVKSVAPAVINGVGTGREINGHRN